MATAHSDRWLALRRLNHLCQTRHPHLHVSDLQDRPEVPLHLLGNRRHHDPVGLDQCSPGQLLLQTSSWCFRFCRAPPAHHCVSDLCPQGGNRVWFLQHLCRFPAPSHAHAAALDAAHEQGEEDWCLRRLRQWCCVSRTHPLVTVEAITLTKERICAIAIIRQYELYSPSGGSDFSWGVTEDKIWM